MLTRRGALAIVSAGVLAISATLFAQGKNAPQVDQKKLNDAQKKEVAAVQTVADAAMIGQLAPNDLGLAWVHEDTLKATEHRTYMPYVVTIDSSKLTGATVGIYWRVVSKDQAAAMTAAAAPPANGKKDDKKQPAARPMFTDEEFTPATIPSGQTGPVKLTRSFTVPAGSYDVYVVVKEPTPDKKGAPQGKTSVVKQSVTVPDLWNDELNTSSVIVAERLDPLPAPLTPQQMIERPYALGAMEIVPATSTKFTTKNELQPFILIYNAKLDSGNKPDVSVEYNFCQAAAGSEAKDPCKAGEKFFNKTNPQDLNAKTLPPGFDVAAGHQLQSGQAIPLASFPPGDYRLEIKVTDKIASKSITREVNFSVSGS
ncbi:MAG TPA: hypothetical protein VHZ73_06690 [Vicinamibacterales bacterium]|jgi:hypothetical protein|nr:hypothetical protein [Vicinamibacterales bacterium]